MDDVQLRGLRKADVSTLVELMSGNNFIRGLTVMPYVSEMEVQRLVEPMETRHWIIAAHEGRAIGYVYLEWGKGRWRNIATLVIGIADEHVGKGVGRQLMDAALWVGFRYLDLRKIELVVYVDNEQAVHLYESVGFVREGIKRRNAFRDGVHPDALVMSILQEHYAAAQRPSRGPGPLAARKRSDIGIVPTDRGGRL